MEHQGAGLQRPSMVTCDPSCHPQLAALVEMDSHNVYTAFTFFHLLFSLAHLNTNCFRSQGAIFNGVPWVDAISCCLCVDPSVHYCSRVWEFLLGSSPLWPTSRWPSEVWWLCLLVVHLSLGLGGVCTPFMLSHIDPCDHILVCMVCHSIILMLTISCFDSQCEMIYCPCSYLQ